jgi:hypothetical protein
MAFVTGPSSKSPFTPTPALARLLIPGLLARSIHHEELDMVVRSRRVAAVLAVALAAAGATVAVAGPAQAYQNGCTPYHSLSVNPGEYISATWELICTTGIEYYPIFIAKGGVEVASGTGTAVYECSGSTENAFSVAGTLGGFEAACG